MKKSTKLIAMLTAITLLVCILAAAIAEDRIFTSEVFSIPKERVEQTILQQPGEETPQPATTEQKDQQEESAEPEIGSDEWWDADSADETETVTETGFGTEGEPETESPSEGMSSEETTAAGTNQEETPEAISEPEPEPMPERKVQIKSSRKDVVIEGEIITLYSRLIGFEGVEVHYQWQVDRGEGAGWEDVEGATGPEHSFVARKDTILYSWRLTIITDE